MTPADRNRTLPDWLTLVDDLEERIRHFTGTSEEYDDLAADLEARAQEADGLVHDQPYLTPESARLAAYSLLIHRNDPGAQRDKTRCGVPTLPPRPEGDR